LRDNICCLFRIITKTIGLRHSYAAHLLEICKTVITT